MSKKKYTVEEVADILYESSEEEDFSPSESSYKPSSNSGNSKADGDNTYEVPLAESLIAEGTKHKELKIRRTGRRPSKRPRTELLNIGDHLPLKGSSGRRCVRCTSLQKETRTNYVCSGCNNALCFKCFASYHKTKFDGLLNCPNINPYWDNMSQDNARN